MKALVLTGVKEFEIQNLATPEILPNEVLINTNVKVGDRVAVDPNIYCG